MRSARLSWRVLLPALVTTSLVLGLGWAWQASRVPDVYSVMDMGVMDLGGGPSVALAASRSGHHHGGGHDTGTSVTELTGPQDGAPDVRVTLEARKQTFTLDTGEQVVGYTLNGTSPGPEIRAQQGDLVEVRLVNVDVPDGVTAHWHGIDVPNAEDGVAGVTQDAVPTGGEHVYRFVAEDAGTYWYHSHQVSHEQVKGGLFGAFVVEPVAAPALHDVVAVAHTYAGVSTLNGRTGVTTTPSPAAQPVRVRLVNTDSGALRAWVTDAPFRVLAIDGRDVHEPAEVRDEAVVVTAGGRVDLEIVPPASGTRVDIGGGTALVLGDVEIDAAARPDTTFDPLGYGTPRSLDFDPAQADRVFDYDIGRRPGFVDGRPGIWWTINGRMFPDVPMYMVAEGDVVRMRISNDSGMVHPMHLHGHHAVVLSRDGVAATGSPWVVDSLHVDDGETYEIAFVADNPGIWMDHCHNLKHAAEGLVAHLAYFGVHGPFKVGAAIDDAGTVNEPE